VIKTILSAGPDFFLSQQASMAALPLVFGDGHFYGKQLLDELDVPIGIACHAAGGSPTESWLSREALSAAPNWTFILQGPGDGITLAIGTLVLPAQLTGGDIIINGRDNRGGSPFVYTNSDSGATGTARSALPNPCATRVCCGSTISSTFQPLRKRADDTT
jgi:hypothetical protein